MDGCEALFDSVYDDVRDSLVSYIMIAFGKSTGKYAETKALNTPPAGWSNSWLRRWEYSGSIVGVDGGGGRSRVAVASLHSTWYHHHHFRARAWVLYTWFPCDISFWVQLRKPSYWALLLVALCPLTRTL